MSIVVNTHQVQSEGLCRRRRQTAIPEPHQIRDPAGILAALANLDQTAGDIANHMVQKGISLNIEHHHIS